MLALRTLSWLSLTLFAVGLAAGQNATPAGQALNPAQAAPSIPASKTIGFDEFIDLAIRQERRMTDLLRNFTPIIETYLQEQQPDAALGTSPKGDAYFLSRLDLAGSAASTAGFADEGHLKPGWWKKFSIIEEPFAAAGFAQALFPDLEHFDRQNYTFEFVRWEMLGEVRCALQSNVL